MDLKNFEQEKKKKLSFTSSSHRFQESAKLTVVNQTEFSGKEEVQAPWGIDV